MLLEQVQNQLEYLYGIGLSERAQDFLIEKKEAVRFLSTPIPPKIPRELFLVRQNRQDTVEVALFLDGRLLKNLSDNSPFVSLNEKNLSDFCILIEGISHFVYFLWKAYKGQTITRLEMELQAEIDKFVMLFFYLRSGGDRAFSDQIFEALFEDFRLFESLSQESEERYLTASSLAMRYCHSLQSRYRAKNQLESLLSEVRQFYNFSQEQKIRHINN